MSYVAPMDRLLGKRVLVTAAGQGIGRAIAVACAAQGADVLATDVNSALLATLAEKRHGEISTAQLDVLDKGAIASLVGGLDRLDVLVNCAGWVHAGTVLEATDDEWEFGFNLNARSMFWMIQAALPTMRTAGSGSIVNIASVASSLKAVPNRFVYSATKAAIIGMTKSVAADFVTEGIRVNAICPGTVDSPSWRQRVIDQAVAAATSPADAEAAFVARQPMGRVGSTDEIAALAVYLGSDESSFTTGQAHIIDGGWAA
jgi:2-keto-3-deoxy-L-fuconate dehydrogenase